MPVLLLGSVYGDAFIELDKNAPEANIFQELFHPPFSFPVQLYSKAWHDCDSSSLHFFVFVDSKVKQKKKTNKQTRSILEAIQAC